MERVKDFCLKVTKNRTFTYVVIMLFCLSLACLSKNYDYDLYARLIVGQSFLEKCVINYRDFLSYTPTHLWYDHEWGASVFFYAFYKFFGAYGFILIQALLMFGTAFFIMKTQEIQRNHYPITLCFMVMFLLLFNHLNSNLVRCHMFSFMFFAMFLFILEKSRRFNSKLIWLLPFLVFLWNNIHGGVVSGLGLIVMYMAGAILSGKPWMKYLGVLVISTPLLAINPYGADYYNFLFSANTKSRSYVVEWWGVFAGRHVTFYYPAFCTSLFVLLLSITKLFKRNIDITKFIVLFVTFTLGAIHVKLLSLVLITLAALYYDVVIRIFNKPVVRFLEKFAYCIVVVSILAIPFTNPFVPKINFSKFPVKEVEFLKVNSLGGNVVTNFGTGSYVAYKLYPQNFIYMDGRYEEVYYDRELNVLAEFERADDSWRNIYLDYPTDIIMANRDLPVYAELQKENGWREIYTGNLCGVFVKKERAKRHYIMPTDNLRYYQKTAFDNMGTFGKKHFCDIKYLGS